MGFQVNHTLVKLTKDMPPWVFKYHKLIGRHKVGDVISMPLHLAAELGVLPERPRNAIKR